MKKIFLILIVLVFLAAGAAWAEPGDLPVGAVPAESLKSSPSPTPKVTPAQAPPVQGDQGNRYQNVPNPPPPANDPRTGWPLANELAAKRPAGLKPTPVITPIEGHETLVMGKDPNPPIRIVRVDNGSSPTPQVQSVRGHETIVETPKKDNTGAACFAAVVMLILLAVFLNRLNQENN